MLLDFYNDAKAHFELKQKVDERKGQTSLPLCSSAELSIAIQAMGRQFKAGDKSEARDIRNKLVIKKLIELLGRKRIPAKNHAFMLVIENLIVNFVSNLQPKSELLGVYYCFILSWFQASTQSPDNAISKMQPFQQILDQLNLLTFKIDRFSGTIGSKFCSILSNDLLQFVCEQNPQIDTLHSKFLGLQKQTSKERRRALLENIKNYKKKIANETAKSIVAAEIRRSIGDGLYPVILLEFVENYYTLFLEKHFILHGSKGEIWGETSKNLSSLIWAFRAEVDVNFHRLFAKNVPPALDSIIDKVDSLVDDKQKLYQDFLAIEEVLKIRKKEGFVKLESVFNVTELSADSLYTNLATEWRYENRSETQWYTVQHKNKEAYCKLIGKEIFDKQVVFTNYSGDLQIAHNTAEPRFQIEQIRAVAVRNELDLEYVYSTIDYEITNLHADYCEANRAVINQIDIDIAAKLKYQHEREKQLEERNRLASEKFERKQKLVNEEKNRAKAKLIEQRKTNSIKRKQFQSEIVKIDIGTLITATLDDGTVASMELNVITSTTNRYVFNDKTCQHKLAVTREKMLDMLVAGKLSIDVLRRPKTTNQILEDVIASRREKLSDGSIRKTGADYEHN